MAIQCVVSGQPNCGIATKAKLVGNLVSAFLESVSNNDGMVATDGVALKIFQVHLRDINSLGLSRCIVGRGI